MIKQKVERLDRAVKKLTDETGPGKAIIIRSFRSRKPGAVLLGYRTGESEPLWPADQEQWPKINGTAIVEEVWSDEPEWREERIC